MSCLGSHRVLTGHILHQLSARILGTNEHIIIYFAIVATYAIVKPGGRIFRVMRNGIKEFVRFSFDNKFQVKGISWEYEYATQTILRFYHQRRISKKKTKRVYYLFSNVFVTKRSKSL